MSEYDTTESPDLLIERRREELRTDRVYQERLDRVFTDAEKGVLPPMLPVEYLVAVGERLDLSQHQSVGLPAAVVGDLADGDEA